MSGSPKCTQASIAAERRRALEEERRRKAALDKVERERVARESHRARMSAIAGSVREILNGIEDDMRHARASGLSVDQVQQLDAEHRHLIVTSDRATDFEALSRLQSEAESFAQRVRRLSVGVQREPAAGRRNLSEEKAGVALNAELEQLQALISECDQQDSDRFDAEGRHELHRCMSAAASEISKRNMPRAREKLDIARKVYRAHMATVLKLRRKWDDNFHRGRAMIEQERSRLVSVQKDQLIVRWDSPRILQAETKLTEAAHRLAQGNWSEVVTCVSSAKDLIDKAVDYAQEQENGETGRRYIVKSMVEVLSKKFNCDAPELVSTDAGSAVVIRARKPSLTGSKQGVEVRVSQEGGIQYKVDGYEMVRQEDDGEIRAMCDQAEEDILAIHQSLLERGVQTTELTWEGKPVRGGTPASGTEQSARPDSIKKARSQRTGQRTRKLTGA
jgi:hypothetical protein